MCLLEDNTDKQLVFHILRYKDQADSFKERFKDYNNLTIEIVDDINELVNQSHVLISCITYAGDLLCPFDELFNSTTMFYVNAEYEAQVEILEYYSFQFILEDFRIAICSLIRYSVTIQATFKALSISLNSRNMTN